MIVVPYTKPHAATTAALTGEAVERWVGGSDRDYFDLLTELWTAGESFTIVEHDIVPTGAAVVSLGCTDWCACPYEYIGGMHVGLGCTRFDADLIARHPDLMRLVGGMSDETHPPRHWCRLDAWITNTLRGRGETRCEQHPEVGHLVNPERSSHGCYTLRPRMESF